MIPVSRFIVEYQTCIDGGWVRYARVQKIVDAMRYLNQIKELAICYEARIWDTLNNIAWEID